MADQSTFYLASRAPHREDVAYVTLQLDAPARKGYPALLMLSMLNSEEDNVAVRIQLNSEQLEELGIAIDHMADHARKASSGHKLNEEVQAEKERAESERERAEEGAVLDMIPDSNGEVYVQEPYLDAAHRLVQHGDAVVTKMYGNTGIRLTLR